MHHPSLLPLHPTLRHPHTGQPLRALYVRRDGRAMWPLIGASPDDPPPADPPNPPAPPAPADPPAPDDLGFPKDTPVAEMTDPQRAAYWKHQAQKHETRYKSLVGDRRYEEAQQALAEYERIQREQMTPAEQAIEAAREEGRTQARTAERRTSAAAIFRGALEAGGITGDDQDELVNNFNVDGFITDDGVDTTKISNFAKRFAQPGTGEQPRRRDFGGGNRGGGTGGSDTRGAKGKAEAQKRFKKTTSGE